jgi:hypothetical protein
MSEPHSRSVEGRLAALALLLAAAVPSTATAGVLEDLRGRWAASAGGPAVVEWTTSGDGFGLSWTPSGGAPTTTTFSSAGRPNVYAGAAKAGWSVMGAMFGDDGPVNPLKGGTLYWARTADDALYVYSLAIDDQGAFVLDRYAYQPEQGGLAVAMVRRTASGSETPQEQKLVRVGQ